MFNKFYDTLKSSHYSLTTPRKIVFEALTKTGPVTTANLSQKCHEQLDQATVYRTIALFEKLGIVNRIWHGFKSHIELSEIFTPHHHHAVCQHCGKNIDIVNSELEGLLAKISKQHSFLSVSHSLELTGYCDNCQSS